MRTTVLTTPRLRLTTWEQSDVLALADLHADPEVMAFLGDGRPEAVSRARVRLQRYVQEHRRRGWTKWRVDDPGGTLVGRAGFGAFDGGRELGYVLARRCWGQGLGTEIARALVAWDRTHPLTPPRPLRAYAVHDNTASRRVLEKTGFTLVGQGERGGRLHAFYELRR